MALSVVPPPTYQGADLCPFRTIAERDDIPRPELIHPPPDGGSESIVPGAPQATVNATKHAFDPKLKQPQWLLGGELPNTSSLLKGFFDAELNNGLITILAREAIMRRCNRHSLHVI